MARWAALAGLRLRDAVFWADIALFSFDRDLGISLSFYATQVVKMKDQ